MKTRIGPVDDPLEREADRIANAIVTERPIGALASAQPAVRRKCASCEEEEAVVRRKCSNCAAEPGVRQKPHAEAAASALAHGGSLLSSDVRAYFEPRFGRDLSSVRVHTGARAAAAASAINARAYTLGSDIAFASGEYAPGSREGQKLIAHELTHAVQQGGAASVIRRQPEEEELPGLEVGKPKAVTLEEARMEHVVPRPAAVEPPCPPPPTGIGNLTPRPDCSNEGGDLPTGDNFHFCVDSDVFVNPKEPRRIRELVAQQPSGSEFQVRAYASQEGPGNAETSATYNLNLSCHRLNRVIRELINAGVQEIDIEGAALSATSRFGPLPSNTHLNRVAVIHPIPQARGPRATHVPRMTPSEMVEAAKKRLMRQDYKHGADAYFARWTCGRYRTLAEAVSRTTVHVAGEGGVGGAGGQLGTTPVTGPSTIILDRRIQHMTDPIECAANRIADLTFHHFVRPVLPGYQDLHAGGMHLIHLAGLGACVDLPGSTPPQISVPDPNDPYANRQPDCADAPLLGAMKPQRGPAKPDTPAMFIASTPTLTDPTGSLIDVSQGFRSAGVEQDKPFRLNAIVDASGEPAAVRDHEIGFVQTVLSEEWVNTFVDGRREIRKLPLPLRDGPPRFNTSGATRQANPLHDPPWFTANSKVKAQPGLNTVSMEDRPNFLTFRVFPGLETSTFVQRQKAGAGGSFVMERPSFQPALPTPEFVPENTGKKPTQEEQKEIDRKTKEHKERRALEGTNVPDRGHRRVQFMTWVVARRIGAPATHGATQFLEGVKLEYSLDADWSGADPSHITGAGSYSTTATRAAQSDSAQMLLRGATPQDFVSDQGETLFGEFLQTGAAVPRDQAQGLAQSRYNAEVEAIVARHPVPGLAPPFVVMIKLDLATGRAILDTPDLRHGAVTIQRATYGGEINPNLAAKLAKTIFPEIRQLVLSGKPQSGVAPFPVTILAP